MKSYKFPELNKSDMTPAQIMQGLQEKNRTLARKNEEYLDLCLKRAGAEREFNVASAHKTLKYRTSEQHVTLIPTLVKGHDIVAKLKFEYDVALAVEKACLESIQDLRSAIDTYRSLLAWLKAELQSQ